VDGTKNSAGKITHSADIIIDFKGHKERVTAEVTDLGQNHLILGYTWLKRHNPEIDWKTGLVKLTRCPRHCHTLQEKPVFLRMIEKEEEDLQYHIQATLEHLEKPKTETKEEKKLTEADLVPKAYHDYLKVFSKGESERMPIRKP
jgi:hypothetical protein